MHLLDLYRGGETEEATEAEQIRATQRSYIRV
jgi:hypothetical protein